MKHHLRRLLAALCGAALLTGSASALTTRQAVDLLETYYVDRLPAAAYEADTLDELFSAIGDPYTYYMDAEEYEAFIDGVEGVSRVGIGVAILYTNEGVLINSIIPGGSAEEAGLEAGDTIVAIDGVPCVPAQESDVARITGEEGTQVALTLLRRDGRQETVLVTRRPFTVPTTTVSLLENGSGYIDCASFASTTGGSFAEGVAEYDSQTDLWLVDLRGNLGGVASAAADAAGVFTGGPCAILYMRNRAGNYSPTFNLNSSLTDAPAVVLTNVYSASASEIFASAIKDYGAGIVVGGRTYGKGVAQIVLDEETHPNLFDRDCLKVTAYRFYSGATNTTDSIGVLPTLLLHDDYTAELAQLLRANQPDDPAGWLRLTLAGWDFYVDVTAALQKDTHAVALSELFAALPPDAHAAVGFAGGWVIMTVPQAAAALEVDYTSRWFTDVDDSPYADALNTLATYDLLRGTGDGTFLPQKALTRAELCAMLSLTLNRVSSTPSPFTDVPDDAWYAPYVTTMYEMGFVQGRGDGAFGPTDGLTQQELVTILGRLADFLNANCHEALKTVTEEQRGAEPLSGFADWAKDYAWLLGLSFSNVDTGETASLLHADLADIDPAAPVLREEAGATLYTILAALGILIY